MWHSGSMTAADLILLRDEGDTEERWVPMLDVMRRLESDGKRLPLLLLCLLLGWLGAHRFYAGKNGTGALYLLFLITSALTLPGIILLIWWIVDAITIISGQFKDVDGRSYNRWT